MFSNLTKINSEKIVKVIWKAKQIFREEEWMSFSMKVLISQQSTKQSLGQIKNEYVVP